MPKQSFWIIGRFLQIALLVNVLTSGLAFAQAVSQISGTTKDSSGTAVPGVYVPPHAEHGQIVPGHIEPAKP